MRRFALIVAAIVAVAGCRGPKQGTGMSGKMDYANYFEVIDGGVVTVSPYDESCDTLLIDKPLSNIICMSTSYIAYLSAAGAADCVGGVSGIGYVSDTTVLRRYFGNLKEGERPVYDVGYDSALDYERVVSMQPDLFVTYTVSSVEPQYISKLKSLGVPVLVLYEHLEDHPLARAEYVKLFGALTGRYEQACEYFAAESEAYNSLVTEGDAGVLMNIPYGDQWFIPGGDNYMSRLVHDAGGKVLGAKEGESSSRVISIEEAYVLAGQADYWLNPGWCKTKADLEGVNPVFSKFGITRIYNNTRRETPAGGNDFWESGCVHPSMILEDLVSIFSGRDTLFHYYVKVD
ncbi:MAG: ABC transporter substrate-binding protein [Bacteroidales bacterium]|nr:ABC transporter substrate-binding protein [Bacteroidales bacterium]